MANCVMCGSWIPDDQGSKTCSMCYGDMGHGKDGYYREWAERQDRGFEQQEYEHRQQQDSDPTKGGEVR